MRLISALLCAMGIHRWKVGGHSLCPTDYCIFCGAKGESDNTRV